MNVNKSAHKLPDSTSPAARAGAAAGAAGAGLAAGAAAVAGAAAAQEVEHASVENHHPSAESHEAQHAEAADTVETICPGHDKPTIIDLFPEGDAPTVQTLKYPENGEPLPKGPPISHTLRYPENGEPMPKGPPISHTLRFPENGEPINKLPKFPIDEFPIEKKPSPFGQTKALGENGEPIDKLPKFPKHEFPIEKRPFPFNQTKAIGENGDFGKPFKPGNPFKPYDPPMGRTLAFPESGENWQKPLNPKDGISPPCKCLPGPEDQQFMRTTAYGMGEGGEDISFKF